MDSSDLSPFSKKSYQHMKAAALEQDIKLVRMSSTVIEYDNKLYGPLDILTPFSLERQSPVKVPLEEKNLRVHQVRMPSQWED